MSDSKLRSDLIRLAASSTPEVKAALLPLLTKKAAPRSQVEAGLAAEDMAAALDEAYEVLSKLEKDWVFQTVEDKSVTASFGEGEARKLARMAEGLLKGVIELRAALQKEWGLGD